MSLTGTPDARRRGGHLGRRHRRRHVRLQRHPHRALRPRRPPAVAPRSRCRCSRRSPSGWGSPATTRRYGGTPPPRSGAPHATIAPYGRSAAATASTCCSRHPERAGVGAVLREQVLDQPELVTDPRFATNSLRVAAPRRAGRGRRRRASPTWPAAAVRRAARRGRHRQRRGCNDVDEFLAHPVLAAGTGGGTIGSPGGAVCARCCRRRCPMATSRAHGRHPRRRGGTPIASWPSSGMELAARRAEQDI